MFYHVSKTDHGETFKFTPKLPESALVSKEGNIPRVCVCPDVFYCLRAIAGHPKLFSFDILIESKGKDGWYSFPTVYQTSRSPFLPPDVSDFRHNHEHWYLTPVSMRRVGYVDLIELTKGKVKIVKNFDRFHPFLVSGEGKDVLIRKRKVEIQEPERFLIIDYFQNKEKQNGKSYSVGKT